MNYESGFIREGNQAEPAPFELQMINLRASRPAHICAVLAAAQPSGAVPKLVLHAGPETAA
jgi:hypothetical protein